MFFLSSTQELEISEKQFFGYNLGFKKIQKHECSLNVRGEKNTLKNNKQIKNYKISVIMLLDNQLTD